MHDPERPRREQDQQSWDEWFNRWYGGPKRLLLVFTVFMVMAMIGLYFSGNSAWFSR